MTSGNNVDEFIKMFCASRRHRIGEFRQSERANKVYILDLDIGSLARAVIQ